MSEMTVGPQHMVAPQQEETQKNDNLKTAMWLYLGSEVVIFTILIAAYVLFRINNPELVRNAQEHIDVNLVGINTFLLLTSSWAMVMGLSAIKRGDRQGLVRWIGLTALLGAIFVGGQFLEYTELGHAGIALSYPDPASEVIVEADQAALVEEGAVAIEVEGEHGETEVVNAREAFGGFGMRFFAPTAFHGAHVIVGVLWALFVVWRGYKGGYDENPIGVEIFGLYWHFVDVVWIFLFSLIYLI